MKLKKPLVNLRQKAEVSFMYLPEYGTKYQLLKKYSPGDLVIYDMAMFYAVENGRACGAKESAERIDGYCVLNVDHMADMAWVKPKEVIQIIENKFSDKLELLKIGDKFLIREKK